MKGFVLCILLIGFASCHTYKAAVAQKQYIIKSEMVCGRNDNKGYKLNLRPPLAPKNYVHTGMCGYNEDKLFVGYPDNEKIALLEALLGYEGDTSMCAQPVCRYGRTKLPRPKATRYTTQVDALYLLTLLAANAYSMEFCPYPVLVERATGKEINDDPVKMKEVFQIYRKWFAESRKGGFINYHLPFSESSPYEWYGAYREAGFIFKNSTTIPRLEASPIVIGMCKD